MRHVLRFGWAAAFGIAISGSAFAQQTGTGGSGTSGGSGASPSDSSTILTAPPQITGLDTSGGARSTGSLQPSNVLGAYYANPYYQGRAGAGLSEAPGGFGTALYGTSTGGTGTGGRSGTTSGRSGTTSGRTGSTSTGFGGSSTSSFGGASTGFGGASTGFGGTSTGRTGGTGFGGTSTGFGGTGAGGFGGTGGGRGGIGGQNFGGQGFGGTGMNNAAQAVPLPRNISYTASLRFAAPPMTAPRMQTEVRAVLDRSISLSNPRAVEVATDGAVVVLRGTVKDEDEARLAENMIRLTPGVREVRNELKFPAP